MYYENDWRADSAAGSGRQSPIGRHAVAGRMSKRQVLLVHDADSVSSHFGTLDGEFVSSASTDVVVRRGVQYVIDVVLSSAVPQVLLPLFLLLPKDPDGSVKSGPLTLTLYSIYGIVWLLFVIWYWILRPARTGRTWGMALLGLRVVRTDGSALRVVHTFLRTLLLIVDGIAGGLLGLVVMLVSERNQRVGDMAAGTLVIRDR